MPRPFHFKLQKVLEYREQIEEQAKLDLASAQRRYQTQVKHVETIRLALKKHENDLARSKKMTSAEMALWLGYKDLLAFDLKQGAQKLQTLAREVGRCREAVIEASKERKLLERMKINQTIKHNLEENSKEQKEFDEMATIRYQPSSF